VYSAPDYISSLQSITEESRRLRRHEPDHPLLRFLEEVGDNNFDFREDPALQDEFRAAYACDNESALGTNDNYLEHLRQERVKLERRGKVVPIARLDDLSTTI